MIHLEHCQIRVAEPDDAPALHTCYRAGVPRAAFLDKKREPLQPSLDELRESLARKEALQGQFFAVEDKTGVVRGFCGLRGMSHEALFGEIHAFFLQDEAFATPIGEDAAAFLIDRGLNRFHLNKLVAHALEGESGYRQWLIAAGFQSDGIQRAVFFTQGRYHALEAFSLFPESRTRAQ